MQFIIWKGIDPLTSAFEYQREECIGQCGRVILELDPLTGAFEYQRVEFHEMVGRELNWLRLCMCIKSCPVHLEYQSVEVHLCMGLSGITIST